MKDSEMRERNRKAGLLSEISSLLNIKIHDFRCGDLTEEDLLIFVSQVPEVVKKKLQKKRKKRRGGNNDVHSQD